MKRLYSLAAASVLVAGVVSCNVLTLDEDPDSETPRHMTGELFVELEEDVTSDQLDSLLATFDLQRRSTFFPDANLVLVPEGQEQHWISVLKNEDMIRSAHLNRFGHDYDLVEGDGLPRLEGDSLYVQVGYSGCSPGHDFTLEYSRIDSSSFEVWLFKENEEDCEAFFSETRAFKVPDEIRNADSVTLIKPVNGRIQLISPQESVYDFGDHYTVLESDNLPRLQGDSLYVTLGYVCAAAFTLRHVETGESSHEIWLHNAGTIAACAVPVIDSARAFQVPAAVENAQSVRLVTPGLDRVELKTN